MTSLFDKARLREAFDLLGRDLAERGRFVEIAVYGGSALMLQFEWRRSTDDVDAVVREGYDESAIKPSVAAVARRMSLPDDWLNDAVGMFTPLVESDDLFEAAGSYPVEGQPGLRVLLATPSYLLALKLQALRSLDRGERDLSDARRLARELSIDAEDGLNDLYRAVLNEEPPLEVVSRFPAVLER